MTLPHCPWLERFVVAIILLQRLFFKFTSASPPVVGCIVSI